jgi:predicted nucleic acid-binding protein
MRLALDSNVLIYAEGGKDAERRLLAHRIIGGVMPSEIVIPLQAAAETFRWLVKKGGLTHERAAERTRWWTNSFMTQDMDRSVFEGAIALVSAHRLQFFDALILSAAEESGATLLLTEDLQDGFRWRGVTVANPFATEPSRAIMKLMNLKE